MEDRAAGVGAPTIVLSPGAAGKKRDGASKGKRESDYATVIDLPFPPAFQEDFVACTKR